MKKLPDQNDPAIELWVPDNDEPAPELSVVVPALNEKITIGEFVSWCREGLAKADVKGEILIVDSSTDETPEIAVAGGARVLRTPRRGLGRAYIDAIPHIRGTYALLGDADCTYDFREIKPFIEKFRAGFEFIMGSRFAGIIEKGAMPVLHQYMGTPVTTSILNLIYGSHFTDIHCGMRGVAKDAFIRMHMQSQSWEYASEMIIKAIHLKLRIAEVPIVFHKDKVGRLSHLKRGGWLEPWRGAWVCLRAMFVYGADFFLYRPGMIIAALGLLLTLPVTFGPIRVGPIGMSLHWMLLGLTLSTLGIQCMYMGILAQVLYDTRGALTQRWLRVFDYNRTMKIVTVCVLAGSAMTSWLLRDYFRNGLRLPEGLKPEYYPAITGLLLILVAFITFGFMLVLHAMTSTRGMTLPRR